MYNRLVPVSSGTTYYGTKRLLNSHFEDNLRSFDTERLQEYVVELLLEYSCTSTRYHVRLYDTGVQINSSNTKTNLRSFDKESLHVRVVDCTPVTQSLYTVYGVLVVENLLVEYLVLD